MKHLIVLFLAIHSFFFLEYEQYARDICSGGSCLAIYCPAGGCQVDGKKIICPDKKCVVDVLNQLGEEHLMGVWRVDWVDGNLPTITKMSPSKSYEIK